MVKKFKSWRVFVKRKEIEAPECTKLVYPQNIRAGLRKTLPRSFLLAKKFSNIALMMYFEQHETVSQTNT